MIGMEAKIYSERNSVLPGWTDAVYFVESDSDVIEGDDTRVGRVGRGGDGGKGKTTTGMLQG